MMRRLEHEGLVTIGQRSATLTAHGREAAEVLVRALRLIECLFVDKFTIGLNGADNELIALAVSSSPSLIVALDDYVGRPATCPHGHPIPRPVGTRGGGGVTGFVALTAL